MEIPAFVAVIYSFVVCLVPEIELGSSITPHVSLPLGQTHSPRDPPGLEDPSWKHSSFSPAVFIDQVQVLGHQGRADALS